jgi:lauroyl/myristoyl acyltransferase
MRRLLGSLHVTGVFWYRFHRWGVSVLPNWAVRPFIALFTTFFFFFLFNIRKAISSNLAAVLKPCGWLNRKVEFTVEGLEIWERLVERGTGFILLTAHIGNWEVGSMMPSTKLKRRIHLVREEELDAKAQEFVRQILHEQADPHFEVHFASRDNAALGAELLAALRQGDVVAVQGDRPRAVGRDLTATLFGRPVSLPRGPAVLARAAGVPMLPVFVFREGRLRSRLVLRELIEVPRDGDGGQVIAEAVQQFVAQLEWAIAQQPHQWFCFRELWPNS